MERRCLKANFGHARQGGIGASLIGSSDGTPVFDPGLAIDLLRQSLCGLSVAM